jgi:hypothetical protein
MTPVLIFHRRVLRLAAVVVGSVALAGCGIDTHTPASQDARLTKAAGVASLSLVLPEGLWRETRGDDNVGASNELNKINGDRLDGDRGARGLVRVNLSGTQVVGYMKYLDYYAHPGWGDQDGRVSKAAATRVYDALGAALDTIRGARTASDPAPEVLIDDTMATLAP